MEMCATGDCITFAHICIHDSIMNTGVSTGTITSAYLIVVYTTFYCNYNILLYE